MYDQFFSPQWVYDRCIEGHHFMFPIFLLCLIFVLTIEFIFFQKKHLAIRWRILLMTSSVVATYIISYFFFLVIGFMVIGCSDAPFWQSITPAHALHARLKEYKKATGVYPKDEQILASLDTALYDKIIKHAKTAYIYDPTTNTYTWIVRPNTYTIAIFDTANDYALYTIPNVLTISRWNLSSYPPLYSGPWERLPK